MRCAPTKRHFQAFAMKRPSTDLAAHIAGVCPAGLSLPRDVVAKSACGGWQIKRNTTLNRLRSAVSWATYLRDQDERHLITPLSKLIEAQDN